MPKEVPQYLVNPYDDPVIVQVRGKASFLNSSPVKELFDRLVKKQGKTRFIIDFTHCTGMDSTFLGILAGLGIAMMNLDPKGSVILCNLGDRNLELIENLGLHRLLTVIRGMGSETAMDQGKMESLENGEKLSPQENARLVLQAHENLVRIDASNRQKFQDVIDYLKNQVDQE